MTSYYYDGLTRTHAKCDVCGDETDCGTVRIYEGEMPTIVGHFCSDSCYDNWKDWADKINIRPLRQSI